MSEEPIVAIDAGSAGLHSHRDLEQALAEVRGLIAGLSTTSEADAMTADARDSAAEATLAAETAAGAAETAAVEAYDAKAELQALEGRLLARIEEMHAQEPAPLIIPETPGDQAPDVDAPPESHETEKPKKKKDIWFS